MDDPAFIRLNSPLVGEGTVKFAVLPFNVYSKFFDVTTDKNGAIVIKSEAKSKEVAFGYYTTVGDGSESMFSLYRAIFQLPALNSFSMDGKTIRDLTLNVNVYPYEYTAHGGKKERVTYTILNSKLNTTIWDKVQDEVYIPDSEVGA
jgi:lipopolysaccharide export system protein LptA